VILFRLIICVIGSMIQKKSLSGVYFF